MEKRKINSISIMGTKYDICVVDGAIDGYDGIQKPYAREIVVRNHAYMLDDTASDNEKKRYYREVLRHELIHAFFSEIGLERYTNDEELVQCLATIFPKISEAFDALGCNA